MYKIDGLYEKFLANQPLENVRPKAVELANLLKTGKMDYVIPSTLSSLIEVRN